MVEPKVNEILDLIVAWANANSDDALMNSYDEYHPGTENKDAVSVYDLEEFISRIKDDPDKVFEEAKDKRWIE
jgi:hypothetical protein